MGDHAAATLPGRHGVEQRAPAVKDADARHPGHLVPGERQEIAAERLHVDRHVPDRLRGVHHCHGADPLRPRAELGHGIDRAERVGNMGEGVELDLGREQPVELGEVELAVVPGHRDVAELRARARGDELPGHEVAVVLHLRQEDDVARLEIGTAPARGHQVDRLGRAAGENDFLGSGGVDEFHDARARALIVVGRPRGQGMEAAVHVRVVALVETGEDVDHGLRALRGGGVVEVDEGLPVHQLVQGGEVGADVFPGGHYGEAGLVDMTFRGGRGRVALQGVERRVPAEGGALDPRGKGVHARERGEVADLLGSIARRHDAMETPCRDFPCLGRGLALELGWS